jgi:hypothetical protein
LLLLGEVLAVLLRLLVVVVVALRVPPAEYPCSSWQALCRTLPVPEMAVLVVVVEVAAEPPWR